MGRIYWKKVVERTWRQEKEDGKAAWVRSRSHEKTELTFKEHICYKVYLIICVIMFTMWLSLNTARHACWVAFFISSQIIIVIHIYSNPDCAAYPYSLHINWSAYKDTDGSHDNVQCQPSSINCQPCETPNNFPVGCRTTNSRHW